MASQNLLQNLTQGANPMSEAFEARTAQLDQKRAEEQAAAAEQQKQRDNDMHEVFKYAGDGFVDEARYLAQQKGLEIPDQVYSNATFAKGLALSKDLYDGEPEKAQRYVTAFNATPGDLQARHQAGIGAGGPAISSDMRSLNKQIAFEQWKRKNPSPTTGAGHWSVVNTDQGLVRVNKVTGETAPTGLMGRTGGAKPMSPTQLKAIESNALTLIPGATIPDQYQRPQLDPAFGEMIASRRQRALTAASDEFQRTQDSAAAQQAYIAELGLDTTTDAFDPGRNAPKILGIPVGQEVPPSIMRGGQPYAIPPVAQQSAQAPMGAQGAPQVPAGLPPGSVYIGTSGGRPVYQDPSGGQYIDDGNP